MEKLLSICIPTFNRANLLHRQLTWLAKEIQNFTDECEVIISDNCSEDETPIVIESWQSAFSRTQFCSNRNAENVGWMRNFLYCLNAASGRYTWIIGDDDVVNDGALAYVLEALKTKPDLSLLYLNFCDHDPRNGTVNSMHWFNPDLADANTDSKSLYQTCISDNIGSVIFISATIFRTQYAREAHQIWPGAMNNWAGLAYWNGYCATKGGMAVTRENYLECTIGVSYWQKDPKAWFGVLYRDIPEVYVKLYQIGYSRQFCRQMILRTLKTDFASFDSIKTNLKYYLWCILKAPRWSANVITTYINSLMILTFSNPFARAVPEYSLLSS